MAVFPLLLATSITTTPILQPRPVQPLPAARIVHPALWVVSDPDTTIYLFGTFHALDGTTHWFKDEVRTAFDASDQLILETLVPEVPRVRYQGGAANVVASAAPQASPVSPVPARQIAPPASFLASTKVVMSASRARGMSSARGADALLRDAAEDCGKPVDGLESFEFQLSMFRSLPAQKAAVQTPETMRAISIALARLQDAWNRGDIDEFQPMLNQMRAQSPVSYDEMFIERNGRWAHWIADRLKQPGTVFVAVGAGHLTGPDSVQNQLATLGVRAGRIN